MLALILTTENNSIILIIITQRLHDKRTFAVDVSGEGRERDLRLIVAIAGKQHQIVMWPTIVAEGVQAEAVKIEETRGCSLFCVGKLVVVGEQSPDSGQRG